MKIGKSAALVFAWLFVMVLTGAAADEEKINGTGCSDNDACTLGDRCWEGSCAPTGNISCNDNNVCTDDACDAQQGCYYTDNTKSCYDNDLCVGSLCRKR